jgi:hypothetical protein
MSRNTAEKPDEDGCVTVTNWEAISTSILARAGYVRILSDEQVW